MIHNSNRQKKLSLALAPLMVATVMACAACSKSAPGGSYSPPPKAMPGLDSSIPAEAQYALNRINQYREAMGLPLWRYDKSLEDMGQKHAKYVHENCLQNKFYTCHFEEPGNACYTKEGDEAAQTSGIDFSGTDPLAGLENLMQAPYHRLQFTDPRPMRVAVGHLHKSFCGATLFVTRDDTAAQAKPAPRFALYPPDGFNDALTTFHGEVPDPTGRKYPELTGTIISIHMGDDDASRFRSCSAKLTDASGAAVSAWVAHPKAPAVTKIPEALYKDLSDSMRAKALEKYRRNHNMVLIMPQKPLKPGTAYRVSAVMDIGGQSQTVQWSFTTRKNTTWKVAPGSSDPASNLGFAVSQSISGDVIELESGEYRPDFNSIIQKSITLRGAGRGKTVLRLADAPTSRAMFYENKDQHLLLLQKARVTLEDLTIKGGAPLMDIEYGARALLRRVAIEPTGMFSYFFVNWGGELYLEDCDFSKVTYPLVAMLNSPTNITFVPNIMDPKNYLPLGSSVPGGKLIMDAASKVPNEQILSSYGGVVEKKASPFNIDTD